MLLHLLHEYGIEYRFYLLCSMQLEVGTRGMEPLLGALQAEHSDVETIAGALEALTIVMTATHKVQYNNAK